MTSCVSNRIDRDANVRIGPLAIPVRPLSAAVAGVSPAIGATDALHQPGNADPKLKDVRLDLFMPYSVTAMIHDGFAAPLLRFPHFPDPLHYCRRRSPERLRNPDDCTTMRIHREALHVSRKYYTLIDTTGATARPARSIVRHDGKPMKFQRDNRHARAQPKSGAAGIEQMEMQTAFETRFDLERHRRQNAVFAQSGDSADAA